MQQIKVKCLVIREVDFSEHDRYITVLTEDGRKLEILCRNARRKGSRSANAARLFCWSEMNLYESRGRFSLDDASLVRSFWGVTQDIEAYALACYFAELAAAMSDTDEDVPALPRIFLNALYAVTEQKRPLAIVKAAFELRLMAESGFAPQLAPCAVCGKELDAPPVYFSVRAGTAACESCARRLGADYRPLPAGALAAMGHILTCELKRLYAFALGGESLGALSRVCEEYAVYYADKSFDSLKFYHSLFDLMPAKGKNHPLIDFTGEK